MYGNTHLHLDFVLEDCRTAVDLRLIGDLSWSHATVATMLAYPDRLKARLDQLPAQVAGSLDCRHNVVLSGGCAWSHRPIERNCASHAWQCRRWPVQQAGPSVS